MTIKIVVWTVYIFVVAILGMSTIAYPRASYVQNDTHYSNVAGFPLVVTKSWGEFGANISGINLLINVIFWAAISYALFWLISRWFKHLQPKQ